MYLHRFRENHFTGGRGIKGVVCSLWVFIETESTYILRSDIHCHEGLAKCTPHGAPLGREILHRERVC